MTLEVHRGGPEVAGGLVALPRKSEGPFRGECSTLDQTFWDEFAGPGSTTQLGDGDGGWEVEHSGPKEVVASEGVCGRWGQEDVKLTCLCWVVNDDLEEDVDGMMGRLGRDRCPYLVALRPTTMLALVHRLKAHRQ